SSSPTQPRYVVRECMVNRGCGFERYPKPNIQEPHRRHSRPVPFFRIATCFVLMKLKPLLRVPSFCSIISSQPSRASGSRYCRMSEFHRLIVTQVFLRSWSYAQLSALTT